MSSVPIYRPRQGGIPDRALAYLRDDVPPGGEISNAALAEALRVGSQVLLACLQPAREAGVVFARQKGGHVRSPLFWSLTDHSAPRSMQASPVVVLAEPRLEDGEAPHHAEPPAPPRTEMQEAGDARQHDGREAATAPTPADRVTEEQRHADERRASAPAGLRVALWSDGTLQIEREPIRGAPELLLFPKHQVRQLIEYLDSISLDLVREGDAA